MQDIYGPERDWGDICDEAYDRRKNDELERAALARLAGEHAVPHYTNDSATPEWIQASAAMESEELAASSLAASPAPERMAGRIVAEFDCAAHAVEYAKKYGFTVTAGINRLFAVREWIS